MGRKVKVGDSGFSATEFNRHVDAAELLLGQQMLGRPVLRRTAAADANFLTLQNVSGGDRRQGEILEIAGNALTDLSSRDCYLRGDTPTLANAFAVLGEPLASNESSPYCQVSGRTIALVNITSESHQFAAPQAGNCVLESAEQGSMRILAKPAGTGEKECAVLLGQAASSDGAVVFELTADLALGGEAAAKICELAGSSYAATGEPITVVDIYPGFGTWAGKSGYRGVAQKRSDDKYDILFMERAALIVKFVTYGDRDPAQTGFDGTVVIAYQHGDRPPPNMTSGRITIQDVEKLFPRALNGGTGLAIWNDVVGIYQCLTVQQQCLTALAQIDDTGGMSAIGYVPIKNFAATSPSPFNLVPSPAPTQAINYHGHKGKDGDYLRLLWDEAATDWVIVAVDRHEADIVIDVRLNDNQTQLQVKTLKCALEYCVEPLWQDKIPLSKC